MSTESKFADLVFSDLGRTSWPRWSMNHTKRVISSPSLWADAARLLIRISGSLGSNSREIDVCVWNVPFTNEDGY